MKYLLALYSEEDTWENLTDAEKGEVFAAYGAYSAALEAAGAMLGGDPLDYSGNGARFRTSNGELAVEDGPFTDTKEQLGGYYLIEADNLDAALDWAARCPGAAHGTIEVRPVWEM